MATRPRALRGAGFTLIEIMAVVMLLAMIFAVGSTQLSSARWDALEGEAEAIASSIDFARQRAIMTGKPHRLLIDLEQGAYRVEWYVSEDQAFAAVREGDFDPEDTPLGEFSRSDSSRSDVENISLTPPARDEFEFYPVPSRELGAFRWLDESVYFVGVDTPSGWLEGGDVEIGFDSDGTAEYVLLEIADFEDHHLTLEIEPVLDRVRRRPGKARS